MIAGSGDTATAATTATTARGRDDGHFLVSRGDREQVIELLKTAFVDDRLTREELDGRVGQALASRTRADLAALTADIPDGVNESQPPPEAVQAPEAVRAPDRGVVEAPDRSPAKYVARHAVAPRSRPKAGTARAGLAVAVTVAVAAKLLLVLMFAASIPPPFLLFVAVCVTAMIVTIAWIRS